MKKESILKRLDTEVVKVFVKKNTTRRVEIIFEKPEGLDLENRKGQDLNCCTFFILKRYKKVFSFPFYKFIIKKMKKDLMPDYKHKPSSREYLAALTSFTSYCKLLNADGKAYKDLINWIKANGTELRDSDQRFPDLKEIALLTNTPYNNIAKYLRDIYNDICSLNADNPKAFAEGSQKIYEIMFNYLGCYGYFNLGLENIPREGERFDFYFIQPKVGSSRFWVKDVQHEIIDGRQIISLRVTHEDPNLYLRLLREKAHLNGELDWREYYGFLRYDTEKRLVKLYRNL